MKLDLLFEEQRIFTKTPRKRKSNSIVNKKKEQNPKPPVDRTTHSHSDGFAINKRVEKKREAIFILDPLEPTQDLRPRNHPLIHELCAPQPHPPTAHIFRLECPMPVAGLQGQEDGARLANGSPLPPWRGMKKGPPVFNFVSHLLVNRETNGSARDPVILLFYTSLLLPLISSSAWNSSYIYTLSLYEK